MKRKGSVINCKVCGTKRYVPQSVLKKGKGKFCSHSCSSKNAVIYMLKARGKSWKANVKKAIAKRYKEGGETVHPRWKGDKVGYFGVHDWITKHFGQPKECRVCGMNDVKRVYHWANLSGKYQRNIKDWKRMCVSCHRKYDYKIKI